MVSWGNFGTYAGLVISFVIPDNVQSMDYSDNRNGKGWACRIVGLNDYSI
jgi:hypothetical protein